MRALDVLTDNIYAEQRALCDSAMEAVYKLRDLCSRAGIPSPDYMVHLGIIAQAVGTLDGAAFSLLLRRDAMDTLTTRGEEPRAAPPGPSVSGACDPGPLSPRDEARSILFQRGPLTAYGPSAQADGDGGGPE